MPFEVVVAKNTTLVALSKVIRGVAEILSIAVIARYLGAQGFGLYSFIFTYLGFFGLLTNLGSDDILAREMSRECADLEELAGNGIIIKLIFSLLAIILASAVVVPLNYPSNTKMLIVITSFIFLFSFRSVYLQIFRINQRFGIPAFLDVFCGILKLILFSFLIFMKLSLLWFLLIVMFVRFVYLVLSMLFSSRLILPRLKFNMTLSVYLLKESLPLLMTVIFVMIFTRIDQLMIFQMKGKAAVGYYAAAVAITEAFNVVIAAFIAPVFPLLSKYFYSSRETFNRLYRFSFKHMLIFSLSAVLLVTLFARQMVFMIYGSTYAPTVPILLLLIWSEFFIFFGTIQFNIHNSIGKQRINVLLTGLSALANIALNFIFIPVYGAFGAAIATVISYGSISVVSLLIKDAREFAVSGWKHTVKPLFALGIVLGVMLFLNSGNLIVRGALLSLFVALLFLLKALKREDLDLLKTVILMRKGI